MSPSVQQTAYGKLGELVPLISAEDDKGVHLICLVERQKAYLPQFSDETAEGITTNVIEEIAAENAIALAREDAVAVTEKLKGTGLDEEMLVKEFKLEKAEFVRDQPPYTVRQVLEAFKTFEKGEVVIPLETESGAEIAVLFAVTPPTEEELTKGKDLYRETMISRQAVKKMNELQDGLKKTEQVEYNSLVL